MNMKFSPKTKIAKIRLSVISIILLTTSFFFFIEPFIHLARYDAMEGDIIAQSLPYGELTELIEGATNSVNSRVGIVVSTEDGLRVNEAIVTVHNTSLFKWIRRGRGNKFAVYRLKPEYQKYKKGLISNLSKYQGRLYDFRYSFDENFIYCSELIYKSFFDLTNLKMGKIKKLEDLDWKPYKETILKMEAGALPLKREMITPIDLVKSIYLEKVFDNGL